MVLSLYAIFYVVAFVLAALAEHVFSARPEPAEPDSRLLANFGLGAMNMAVAAVVPLGSLVIAAYAEAHHIGLLQQVAAPAALVLAAGLLWQTLVGYALHRAFHVVPFLWRFHSVHHTDHAVDASTMLRTHPVEMVLSLIGGVPIILIMGTPVWAIATIELTTFLVSALSHANIRVPGQVNRLAALVVSTPVVHLVHHSAERAQCDSNYGDILTIWDRLFGTFRSDAHVARLGVDTDGGQERTLLSELQRPFRSRRALSEQV
jgi:sterol desaturase/sphingolipid hydroxylase (fatty acid hydroxylase superfamily)